MRASLVFVGMGCLLVLFLPVAAALSVVPDELTRTVKQGQVILFHLTGTSNETLTLSTDHVAAEGVAVTVPLGRVRLDANGTADFPLRIVGDLAAVVRWQLRVANATTSVKVFYGVDWDPAFLLEMEAENIALWGAVWARIETFILWVAAALILTMVGTRMWHAWEHTRPGYLRDTLGQKLGRVKNIASTTDMGFQPADKDPLIYNRMKWSHEGTLARRDDRAAREWIEKAAGAIRKRDLHLERQELHRRRVLIENPGDPLVSKDMDMDISSFLEAEELRDRGLLPEEDDGGRR